MSLRRRVIKKTRGSQRDPEGDNGDVSGEEREDPKNDEKLLDIINEMRENEVLHNIAHRRYKMDHNLAIDNVAKKLKMTSKEVIEKIRYIKRQHKRCLHTLRHHNGVTGRSGAGLDDLPEPEDLPPETSKKLWKWFRHCEFLKCSVHHKVNKKYSRIPNMPNYDVLTELSFSPDNPSTSRAVITGGQLATAGIPDDTQNVLHDNDYFLPSPTSFSPENSISTILTSDILSPHMTSPEATPRPTQEYTIIDHGLSLTKRLAQLNPRNDFGTIYSSQQEIEVFPTQLESSRLQSPDLSRPYDHSYTRKVREKTTYQASRQSSSSAQASSSVQGSSSTQDSVSSNELRSFLNTMLNDHTQNYSNSTLLKLIHDLSIFLHKFNQEN